MPKFKNPPNTPEFRCIEDVWGLIKKEAYKDCWEAENLHQLRALKVVFDSFYLNEIGPLDQ